MESTPKNNQPQIRMESESKSKEKASGSKRSMLGLLISSSPSQNSDSQHLLNDSSQKKLASKSQETKRTLKALLEPKQSTKIDDLDDLNSNGMLLGKKTIKNDNPNWKSVPFGSQIQFEVDGSKTRLLHNQKIVGLLLNSIVSKFELLRKKAAILIEVKKQDSSSVSILFHLNKNYNSEEISSKIDDPEAIRSLFMDLDYKMTKPAFLRQFKEIDPISLKINLNTNIIDKTIYNPFDNISPDSAKESDKPFRKIKTPNSDAMILENHGPEESKKQQDGKGTGDQFGKKSGRKGSYFFDQVTLSSAGFISKLEKYQIEGLNWMLSREGKQPGLQKRMQNLQSKESMHPVFEEWTKINWSNLFFNTQNNQILKNLPKTEESLGGIFADDAGLGKTVTTIALILSNPWKKDVEFLKVSPPDEEDQPEEDQPIEVPVKKSKVKRNSASKTSVSKGGTLILCNSLHRDHWKNEINKHTQQDALKVLLYDAIDDKKIKDEKICENDVVIVSYDSLKSGEHAVLARIIWYRAILDEPYDHICSSKEHCSKIVFSLQAKHRWAISRSPTQNKLANLYELLRFLKVDFWDSNELNWNKLISQVHSSPELLHSILRPIMLRRTKESISLSDQKSVNLPPKTVDIKYIRLESEEEKVYHEAKKDAVIEFMPLYGKNSSRRAEDAPQTRMNETISIFKKTAKMRQACDHPLLLEASKQPRKIPDPDIASKLKEFLKDRGIKLDSNELHVGFLQQRIDALKDIQVENCPICEEPPETLIFTVCGHTFCSMCFSESLSYKSACPNCRKDLTDTDFLPFSTVPLNLSIKVDKSSSKVDAVMGSIISIALQKEKCVCFTQWMLMMDILGDEMIRLGIKFVKIDENCSKEEKCWLLKEFSEDMEVTVLVVSLMLDGVWLDLTKANHVLLVEPWWNPKAEEQAIGLVHKFGQTKPVHVIRFACKGTIEERMISLPEYKKQVPNLTLEQEFRYLRDI